MLSRAVLVPLSSPKRLYLLLNNEQQLSTKLAEYRVEFVWLHGTLIIFSDPE